MAFFYFLLTIHTIIKPFPERGEYMSSHKTDENAATDSDQRYFPRWEVKNAVSYQLDKTKETYEGYTQDLSCAGACITSDTKFAPNQKIKLTVYLSPKTTVNLNGNILWAKKEGKENQIGVSFYNTGEETQELILQHAFNLHKEKFLKHLFDGWKE